MVGIRKQIIVGATVINKDRVSPFYFSRLNSVIPDTGGSEITGCEIHSHPVFSEYDRVHFTTEFIPIFTQYSDNTITYQIDTGQFYAAVREYVEGIAVVSGDVYTITGNVQIHVLVRESNNEVNRLVQIHTIPASGGIINYTGEHPIFDELGDKVVISVIPCPDPDERFEIYTSDNSSGDNLVEFMPTIIAELLV